MPTPIAHLAVGCAIGAWAHPAVPLRRVCVMAALAAALPDIDVIAWPLHLADTSLLSHRAITHSLAFALIATMVTAGCSFPGKLFAERRAGIVRLLGLAFLSHGSLDALSTYSVGVEFFAQFSEQRFRFVWTPLGDPHGSVASQLIQEGLVLILPAILVGWWGFSRRVRRVDARAGA